MLIVLFDLKKYLIILLFGGLGLVAFKADDYFEISKNLEIFADVYKQVNTSYVDEVKPGELIRAAINGMLASLDPYTNFYSEAQAELEPYLYSPENGWVVDYVRLRFKVYRPKN